MLGDAVDVGFCGAIDDDDDSRRLSIAGRGIRLGSQWQSLYGPLHETLYDQWQSLYGPLHEPLYDQWQSLYGPLHEPLYEPLVSVSLSLFRLLHANIHA